MQNQTRIPEHIRRRLIAAVRSGMMPRYPTYSTLLALAGTSDIQPQVSEWTAAALAVVDAEREEVQS